jgi:hypothetical protein
MNEKRFLAIKSPKECRMIEVGPPMIWNTFAINKQMRKVDNKDIP